MILQLHEYGRRPHPLPADRVNKANKGVDSLRNRDVQSPMRGSA